MEDRPTGPLFVRAFAPVRGAPLGTVTVYPHPGLSRLRLGHPNSARRGLFVSKTFDYDPNRGWDGFARPLGIASFVALERAYRTLLDALTGDGPVEIIPVQDRAVTIWVLNTLVGVAYPLRPDPERGGFDQLLGTFQLVQKTIEDAVSGLERGLAFVTRQKDRMLSGLEPEEEEEAGREQEG